MWLAWALSGFLLGILVCYLADVLPVERHLARPHWWPFGLRSFFSYLNSPRNLGVLAAVVAVALFLSAYPQSVLPAYQLLLIFAYFCLVIVIDIEHRLVLHMVSLAGGLLLGGIGVLWHGLLPALLGGLGGFGIMLGLFLLGEALGRLVARLRRRPWTDTALGFGDVTISGVIGLLLGWPGVFAALFFGIFSAGAFGLLYLVWAFLRKQFKPMMSIAYAPFLCFGALLTIALAIFN